MSARVCGSSAAPMGTDPDTAVTASLTMAHENNRRRTRNQYSLSQPRFPLRILVRLPNGCGLSGITSGCAVIHDLVKS